MSQNITTEDVEFKPVLRIPKTYLTHLHEVLIITCTVIVHIYPRMCINFVLYCVCMHVGVCMYVCVCVCLCVCVHVCVHVCMCMYIFVLCI